MRWLPSARYRKLYLEREAKLTPDYGRLRVGFVSYQAYPVGLRGVGSFKESPPRMTSGPSMRNKRPPQVRCTIPSTTRSGGPVHGSSDFDRRSQSPNSSRYASLFTDLLRRSNQS